MGWFCLRNVDVAVMCLWGSGDEIGTRFCSLDWKIVGWVGCAAANSPVLGCTLHSVGPGEGKGRLQLFFHWCLFWTKVVNTSRCQGRTCFQDKSLCVSSNSLVQSLPIFVSPCYSTGIPSTIFAYISKLWILALTVISYWLFELTLV